jgi:hypothetical protein
VLSAALALGALLSTPLAAQAARRPAPPAGVHQLAPGQLPTVCTGSDVGSGDSSVSGVYYDRSSNGWLSAPYCYQRWGNLEATPPQVAEAGKPVTVAAIPTQGSNSATYAPQTKSISWAVGAKRVSGCGAADLTCTFIPAAHQTHSWQWIEVEVSMPRTFFIDSPGSNCAGQHLCAGFETHAWTWIGVAPDICYPISKSARIAQTCATQPRYTQEEKDYAKYLRRFYADKQIALTALTVPTGSVALYTGATPGGQPVALAAGILTLTETAAITYYSYWQEVEARIAEDPRDRRWRTLARPLATSPGQIKLPGGLSRLQQRAVRVFLTNELRSAALADCVTLAIDRGTTALRSSVSIAAAQYRAGAACARENARLSAATPRLAAPIVTLLRRFDARMMSLAARAPRGRAVRRAVTRQFDALGRTIAIPRSRLTALRRRALAAPGGLTVLPSAILAEFATVAAAGAPAMRRTAAVLAAAAGSGRR